MVFTCHTMQQNLQSHVYGKRYIGRFFLFQGGETDQIQRIDNDVANMNTIQKYFIAIPLNFKCPLSCTEQNICKSYNSSK